MAGDDAAEADLLWTKKNLNETGPSLDVAVDDDHDADDYSFQSNPKVIHYRSHLSPSGFRKLRYTINQPRYLSAFVVAAIVAILLITALLKPKGSGDSAAPTYCSTWSEDESDWPHMHSDPPRANVTTQVTGLPAGTKVVGIIFYGRAQYIDILDCYLKRNLKSNGGVVDEFVFLNHTMERSDWAYIPPLIASEPGYSLYSPPERCGDIDYGCIWSATADPDTLYIKIDDDITYIHDNAIPQLIQSRIDNPDAFAISANLINSPLTGWLHYHLGAIHAYLPEIPTSRKSRPHRGLSKPTWRPSELPSYDHDLSQGTSSSQKMMKVPFMGHRWLPVKQNGPIDVLATPFGQVDSPRILEFEQLWRDWTLAAQQHYSLFQNLEDDAMHRYHLGPSGGLWNTQYKRFNLNFVAVWGRDVRANLPIDADDEEAFTVTLPHRTRRPLLIDTRAVVSHFHFYPQRKDVMMTDALDRYRAYANEKICARGNKKRPLPTSVRCSAFDSRPAEESARASRYQG